VSILDSQTEIDEAKARLAAATPEQLTADLAYWHLAQVDHGAEYAAAMARVSEIRAQYSVAQGMTELVVAELRKRRDAKRTEG
jgi:hypothetical protein